MRRFKQYGAWLALLMYIVAIQLLLDWRRVLAAWSVFPPAELVIGVVLACVTYALRSLRFYCYFSHRYALDGRRLLRLTLHHNFLNNLLPARSGEISFPVLMKRYFGVPWRVTAPALLWLRLLDLHTVLTPGVSALLWQQGETGWLIAFLLLWPCLPWLVYAIRGRLSRLARKNKTLHWVWLRLAEGFPRSPAQFVWSWGLTWANWLVKLLVLAWILSTLLTLNPAVAIIGVILGELTAILPIHAPAGIGSYEAGVIAGLTPFGVDLASAGAAAINLHLFVLGVASSGGLLALALGWRDRSANQGA